MVLTNQWNTCGFIMCFELNYRYWIVERRLIIIRYVDRCSRCTCDSYVTPNDVLELRHQSSTTIYQSSIINHQTPTNINHQSSPIMNRHHHQASITISHRSSSIKHPSDNQIVRSADKPIIKYWDDQIIRQSDDQMNRSSHNHVSKLSDISN